MAKKTNTENEVVLALIAEFVGDYASGDSTFAIRRQRRSPDTHMPYPAGYAILSVHAGKQEIGYIKITDDATIGLHLRWDRYGAEVFQSTVWSFADRGVPANIWQKLDEWSRKPGTKKRKGLK